MRSLILVLALFGAYASAEAQSLDEALAYFERGEADEALNAFEALREGGELGPAELARVERYLGIVHASLGEEEQAFEAFARSLAIDTEQGVPQEIGPDQQAFFESARRSRERALNIRVQRSGDTYQFSVDDAPANWIASLEASYGARESRSEGSTLSAEVLEAEWMGERLPVRLVARDRFGNVVLRDRVELTRPARADDGGRRRRRAWAIGLTSALVVAGGAFAAIWFATRGEDGFAQGGSVDWGTGDR